MEMSFAALHVFELSMTAKNYEDMCDLHSIYTVQFLPYDGG